MLEEKTDQGVATQRAQKRGASHVQVTGLEKLQMFYDFEASKRRFTVVLRA
jgi:hypothetical protein